MAYGGGGQNIAVRCRQFIWDCVGPRGYSRPNRTPPPFIHLFNFIPSPSDRVMQSTFNEPPAGPPPTPLPRATAAEGGWGGGVVVGGGVSGRVMAVRPLCDTNCVIG